MRTVGLLASALAVVTAVFSGAAAADAFQPGKMELYPTYNAVGVEIPFTGDIKGAIAEMSWRKAGESAWRNGVDMTVDREKGFFWASIWPLDEGTAVEVKVDFKDSTGVEAATLEGEATTRHMVLEADGGEYYVSPDGDDANAGTKEKPFGTITKAASVAKGGDTVRVAAGVYKEGNLFAGLKGETDKPIIFVGAEDGGAVIDGSAEIPKGDGGWEALEGGVFARAFESPTGYAGYVGQDGARMFCYWKLDDFNGDVHAVKRGWFYDAAEKRLYVRTGDGSAPSQHTYNVAIYEYGLHLTGSANLVVRGFDIRYFGAAGVRVSEGTTGCVVIENSIHNVPGGVFLKGDATRDNAFWRNEIYETGLVDFSWNAIKASEYARQGITGYAGRGTSICYNRIHGFFDGVAPVSWRHPDELIWNRDCDIMYNQMRNIGDDAIEIDGGGVNMRIHGNTMRNVFAAISLAPVERGPVYCTRNDATYYMLMFKLNVGGCTSLGWTYTYHNSGYSLINTLKGQMYGGIAISLPPRWTIPIANKVFKNNAIIGNIYAIRSAYPDTWFDHDCLYHARGDRPLVFTHEVKGADGTWTTVRSDTLGAFREAAGQEKRGLYADPEFVSTPGIGGIVWQDYGPTPFSTYPQAADLSAGDLRLSRTSPCIDAGAVIRGVNEDFAGRAPDIGAFEKK